MSKENKLVVSQISLAPRQKRIVAAETPADFIKTRKGKGGKEFKYTEVGYTIAKLNEAFSPVGWDFEVVEEKVIESGGKITEVWVKGKLTVIDHKNGWRVSKNQYGTKKHYGDKSEDNLLGDTLKSAASDALKKCASLFGVALDVYWQQLDDSEQQQIKAIGGKSKSKTPAAPKKPATPEEKFEKALKMIGAQNNIQVLREWRAKIDSSKDYNTNQKVALLNVIDGQIKKYEKENGTTKKDQGKLL